MDEIQEIELLTAYAAKMKETVESYEDKIDELQSIITHEKGSLEAGITDVPWQDTIQSSNALQDEITKLRSELNAAATKELESRTQ